FGGLRGLVHRGGCCTTAPGHGEDGRDDGLAHQRHVGRVRTQRADRVRDLQERAADRTMNGYLRGMTLALGAALMLPAAAQGQACTAPIPAGTCTATTSTALTVGLLIQLTLSSTTTTLAAPALSDYDAGFVANQGPIATVKSNRAWRLQLSGAAATWTATNTQPGVAARPNKPTTDLQWSTAVGGPFAGLTSAPVTAVSGAATAGATTNFYYHTLYSWTLD